MNHDDLYTLAQAATSRGYLTSAAQPQTPMAAFLKAATPEVIIALIDENRRYREALEEIKKGEGRFSRDPLQHATNTIEDMIELAREALHDH